MKRTFSAIVFILLGSSLLQHVQADTGKGSALHQQHCIACHAQGFANNGSEIYTRGNRQINSLAGLRAQVNMCQNNLGLAWFDEEVKSVVSYLNQQYYRVE